MKIDDVQFSNALEDKGDDPTAAATLALILSGAHLDATVDSHVREVAREALYGVIKYHVVSHMHHGFAEKPEGVQTYTKWYDSNFIPKGSERSIWHIARMFQDMTERIQEFLPHFVTAMIIGRGDVFIHDIVVKALDEEEGTYWDVGIEFSVPQE